MADNRHLLFCFTGELPWVIEATGNRTVDKKSSLFCTYRAIMRRRPSSGSRLTMADDDEIAKRIQQCVLRGTHHCVKARVSRVTCFTAQGTFPRNVAYSIQFSFQGLANERVVLIILGASLQTERCHRVTCCAV